MNRYRILSLFATLVVPLGAVFTAPAALADSPWHTPHVPAGSSAGPAVISPDDSPWGPVHK